MRTIALTPGTPSPLTYVKEDNTFYGTEREIPFDTSYKVTNLKTGRSEQFDFVQSTGSEWDPKTRWIYKSPSGISLVISNDEEITALRADAYLKAKLQTN
jgi:hypothetical protein